MKQYSFKKKTFLTLFVTILLFVILLNPLTIANTGTIITKNTLFENPLNFDWWSMYRHDLKNTGFSTSEAPDTNDVLWSYTTMHIISSSPAVSNGKIYIGSWDGQIYCFDLLSGSLLWNYTTQGEISGSPAVADDKVVVGSKDRYIYCFDANTGDMLWNFSTGFLVSSSPVIYNQKVYCGSSDGSLYCLDFDTGGLIWDFDTQNVILSSPAVVDDKVIFGSLSGILYCLNNTNGDMRWSFQTMSGISSSVAVGAGTVFFGSTDFNVYCLNIDNGSVIWNYQTLGEVHSSPALGYNRLYIGSNDGGMYCLNSSTGSFLWKYEISGSIQSDPSVADGKVFFGTEYCCGFPNFIVALDAISGGVIWDYNLGQVGVKSSPAITAGKVVIGSGDGVVYVFGEDTTLYADAHGPYEDHVNTPIQFLGSAYGGTPPYSWLWDFGDGNTSTEQNPMHTFSEIGTYPISLTVEDAFSDLATDSTFAEIIIPNKAPQPPEISGPETGLVGENYEYVFTAVDPEDDSVIYYIEWGDGSFEDWIGPYNSGEELHVNHTWDEKDSYTIRAKAKDIHGDESNWSELNIAMPVRKTLIDFPLLELFITLFQHVFLRIFKFI